VNKGSFKSKEILRLLDQITFFNYFNSKKVFLDKFENNRSELDILNKKDK
jgi:hypothetical protein